MRWSVESRWYSAGAEQALKALSGGGSGGVWHPGPVVHCPLLWCSKAHSRADAVISLREEPQEQVSQWPLSRCADARAGKAPEVSRGHGMDTEEPGRPESHPSSLPVGCVASDCNLPSLSRRLHGSYLVGLSGGQIKGPSCSGQLCSR